MRCVGLKFLLRKLNSHISSQYIHNTSQWIQKEHKLLDVASTTVFYVHPDLVRLLWEGLPDLNPLAEVAGEVSSWLIILVLYYETDAELLDPLKNKAFVGIYTNNT